MNDPASALSAAELQRALGELQRPAAGTAGFATDAEAIAGFLGEFADVPHTQRSYRKEVVRFHLWCRLQRQRDLAGITRADVQAWEGFLAAPPPEWIGPRHARLGSPGWRPFEGPLTAASRRQAAVILGGFYGYLQRCRYLDYNPFLVMRRRAGARTDATAPMRVLSRETLERVLQVLGSRADAAGDARRRDEAERRLFTVRFLVNAGLRRAELARAHMSDLLQREDGDGRPAQWFLSVCGKGGRLRQVALNEAALQALGRWRSHLQATHGLDAQQGALLVPWKRAGERAAAGVSEAVVYRLVKAALADAGRVLAAEFPADAALLTRASPHWLRHSYATLTANADVPLELVRDQLGHASLDTTLLYRHREDLERARRLRHVAL
ncbi:MAG TPA: tyrosine-type recombinase/integrase [Plasticicumulans sp.]|uniref:tyrosine-type recombinase/integrase n=1 Tax=Plasticicumulans sp. TaxID=2307179 RepID=UPI002CD804B0|nr:tyrosine-type recombinase/integrase [Plasticicumulans sp.]HNG48290.1 tyrosine-type recombinase/integrase [Plasticicumulans sp.]